jgi:hypothetical protein
VHRALRPAGLLLDLHPGPEPALVEVLGPRGAETVCPVRDPTHPGRVTAARRVLQRLVASGYYRRRRREVFTFLHHFDSAESWRAYLAEWWTSAEVDDEDVARVAAALARTGGEVLIRERVRATAYARGDPPDVRTSASADPRTRR